MKYTRTTLFFIISSTLFAAHTASAYVPLEPEFFGGGEEIDIAQAITSIYNVFFAIVVIAAVLTLMWAGFTYMITQQNPFQKLKSKDKIKDALFGLVLALLTFVILNTINPAIIQDSPFFSSSKSKGNDYGGGLIGGNYTPPSSSSSGGNVGGQNTQGPAFDAHDPFYATDEQARTKLRQETDIDVFASACGEIDNAGTCSDKNNSKHTSLQGMKAVAMEELIGIAQECEIYNGGSSCGVILTGATEDGHTGGNFSHSNGYKFDLDKADTGEPPSSLDTFLSEEYGRSGVGIKNYSEGVTSKGDSYYTFDNGVNKIKVINEGNHWDIQVIPLHHLNNNVAPTPEDEEVGAETSKGYTE